MPATGVYFVRFSSSALHDGALDVLGRGKIRLARSEVRDVNPLRFQFLRFLQHHHRRRDADAIHAVRKLNGFFHFLFRGQFHTAPQFIRREFAAGPGPRRKARENST